MAPQKFIHLTDTHVLEDGKKLCGLDPAERLRCAIDHINTCHGDARFVVVSGDLACYGLELGYDTVKTILADLSLPYHLMLGNHDNRATFRKVFPEHRCDPHGFIQYDFQTSQGRFVVLDTAVTGAEHGALCSDRLDWLEGCLREAAAEPVFLFMHHPPFDVGIPCLDAMALLEGRERLAALLRSHGNVRHVFYGHVHRSIWGSWQGIATSSLPGTNHQVALDVRQTNEMYGTHEPPAYGVCLVSDETVAVHLCYFLATGPHFDLLDRRSIEAQSPDELIQTSLKF